MDFAEKMMEAAEEGCVLLRNEQETLPLTDRDRVAVFGRVQCEYYRGGTGSGGSVHVPYITTIIDEMQKLEHGPTLDLTLIEQYKNWIQAHPFDNGGGGWAAEPYCQQDMPITEDCAKAAATRANKAIYIVGRTAGEDKDYQNEEGSYLLSRQEKENIRQLCRAFAKVAVVFNVSGIIDMGWIDEADFTGNLTALLYIWQGGQEGGRAAARVLCGKTTPSGKLTDTIARSLEDYPSTATFGDCRRNIYQEDIYVGYRYFCTFAPQAVLFPFGYGLSYAQFSIEDVTARLHGKDVQIEATVRNTGGTYAGKETVQVYYSAPQGSLGKAERALAAFAKTRLLTPGETQRLLMSFSIDSMASYDDSGASGHAHAYVLEAGNYTILVGSDSRSATPVPVNGAAAISIPELRVIRHLQECCAPELPFTRLRPGTRTADGTYQKVQEAVPLRTVDLSARIQERLPPAIPHTGNTGIRFDDVKKDPSLLDSFVAQLTEQELETMVRGEGMMSQKVTPGIAAAYGGVSEALHKYGIPCAGCSDGPSGIRLDTGKEANLMPIGTALACTWNPQLIKELYVYEGKELAAHQIDALLGPGMNIHRNPLNGRNFEYFSEDPLLSGRMAIAQIEGLQDGGSNGTIKHFAANNQEAGRRESDSVLSERALREIYLKGFEIAVAAGRVTSLMTSYNAINGHWAASNYDLVTMILREEWGYTGLVMSDWWAVMNDCVHGGKPSIKNTASMVRARNDVYMVVDNDVAETNGYGDNLDAALKAGELTIGELQSCAKDILRFLLQAPVSRRPLRALKETQSLTARLSAAPVGSRTIQEDEHFTCASGERAYFHAEHDALYTICGCYAKGGDSLSQSVCNIFIDGVPAASLECRSTAGKDTFVNAAQLSLSAGWYAITMEHTKPGIELRYISISSKVVTPVSMGIIS